MSSEPLLAVIGGSGLCTQDVFPVIDTVRPTTAYGETSDTISICSYRGATRTLAFLPRHGANHTLAPHKIPYRANLAALRSLGVRQVIATCIAGSLRRRIWPGDLVIPDQFVNLTWGRDHAGSPELIHMPMADPYCPRLRSLYAKAGAQSGLRTHSHGTVAVIQGPRFSTRAESRWFARQGWSLVNMTQYPECYVAREFGLCYATMAMITDYDCGVGRRRVHFGTGTSVRPILDVFRRNVAALKNLLAATAVHLPLDGSCDCRRPLPPEYYKQHEQGSADNGETL
ncbi:MAG: MTAP family purine nucleoside phosphorylase [Pseudonocardiaceae bacterium]